MEGGSDLSTSRLPPFTKRSAGLTLIEMIGVMAILSILATMLVPNIIDKIQDAQQQSEDNKLEEIAGALVKGIKAQGKLPDLTVHPTNSNGWVAMAAPFTVLGTNAIWKVYPGGSPGVTNSTARRVYFSQQLLTILSNSIDLPPGWTDDPSKFYRPLTNIAPLFIVSSSKPDLQLACPTNANISTNEQDWLKNWIKAYDNKGNVLATNRNIVGVVEGTTARWTNRGQFLHVKIVDLAPFISNINIQDWHGNIPASFITYSPSGGNFAANGALSSPLKFEKKDSAGNSSFISFAFAGNSSVGWQGSLSVHPETYSTKLGRDIFVDRPTGSGGADNKIDGINAWRRVSLGDVFAIGRNIFIDSPAGPFYSVGTGPTNRVSKFGNPNAGPGTLPDEIYRRDTANFYALYGTQIKLFEGQESSFPPNTPNLQKNLVVTEPYHQLVFSNGIWIEK